MGIAPGRRALVTGAGSGSGLEIARRLIAAEARVAGIDRSAPALDAASEQLGNDLLPIEADVRDPAVMERPVTLTADRFGGLDTLVVSAGVIHIKPPAEATEADWDLTPGDSRRRVPSRAGQP